MKVKRITKCRVCSNTNLVSVVNLGYQYLTGVFPEEQRCEITCGPLELVKCHSSEKNVVDYYN